MEFVNFYRTEAAWDDIDEDREADINQYILPLIPSTGENILIKTWDCLLYMMEAEFKEQQNKGTEAETIKTLMNRFCTAIDSRVKDLLKQKNIPAISTKEKELQRMRNAEYLMDGLSLERAEEVRKDLRDLMVYLPKKLIYVELDGDDVLIDKGSGFTPVQKPYPQRFADYLYNSNDPKLAKISNLDELSDDEKSELDDIFRNQIGTAAEFSAYAGNTALLPFLRLKLGIDDRAIRTKFGSFLNENVLNEMQLTVMYQIIDFAKANGDIAMSNMVNTSPFSDMDLPKIFGDKIQYIKDLVNGLHKPVQ
jgi:type I restriction enzyme R subunit